MSTAKPKKAVTATQAATAGSTTKRTPSDEENLNELLDLLKLNPATPANGSANPNSVSDLPAGKGGKSVASGSSTPSISNSLSDSSLPAAVPSSTPNTAVQPASTATSGTSTPARKRSKNAEESRLDSFLLRHSKRYEFTGESYSKLLSQLVESRLLNLEWERNATREHRLRVLRAIRVLSRDPALQDQFLRLRPLPCLSSSLARYTKELFESEPPYAAESIVEICSILKRVSSEESQDKRLFEQPFLRSLVALLSARDSGVLQAVLVTLVNLSGSPLFVPQAMELPLLEPLLNIVNEYTLTGGQQSAPTPTVSASSAIAPSPSPTQSTLHNSNSASSVTAPSPQPFSQSSNGKSIPSTPAPSSSPSAPPPAYHFLAGELLDLLTEYHEARREIHLLSGNAVFLRLLHRNRDSEAVCLPVLRCLANQALEPESSREIRLLGGIQLLLSIISDSTNTTSSSTTMSSNNLGSTAGSSGNSSTSSSASTTGTVSPSLFPQKGGAHAPSDAMLISCLICLTQLALDDENASQIRRANGVYTMGMLFLRGGLSNNTSTSTTTSSRDVQAHACRALRFLYSVERNRKIFKRLFPLSDLFAAFVDIGHYVHAIEAYEKVVDRWNEEAPANKALMYSAFEESRAGALANLPNGAPRVVRGYVVQEVLGKGAFGTVYQVQKENGDKLYAMKELSLKELQKAGHIGTANAAAGSTNANEAVKKAASEMGKEVEILSQLDHPNIVRYYSSFQEGANVYIIMELVEGSSLLDHINSFVEKGVLMAEEAIWPIFIQLCLALCYMHMEKRVVHRDLTPSNIMISADKKVKLTDFGLAKQTHNGTVLQSAVGTISFSCPEIVMSESYTDKADIWSLGAILYQMATGKPAFAGSNPLTVAQKIVSGSYTPLPATYSPLFHEMVRRLLTVDPHQRPDVLTVSSLISPLLMAELDRVNIAQERTIQQLNHEAERHRREKEEWMREKQTWRKWMAATAAGNRQQQQQNGPFTPPSSFPPNSTPSSQAGFPFGSSASTASLLSSPTVVGGQLNITAELGSGSAGANAGSSSGEETDMRSPAVPSGFPLFHLPASQLRPTSHDPLTLLLGQLHKLVYITQLPPKSTRDLKRTIIAKYKQALFNRPFVSNSGASNTSPSGSSAQVGVDLKRELQLLVSGSSDLVDASFELPHMDSNAMSTAASPHTTINPANPNSSQPANAAAASNLSHEELQIMIEQVLEESGYYSQQPQP